jgi:hypothetical protein
VYEDEWFNYKAAFEAFITVKDAAESRQAAAAHELAAGHRKQPAGRPKYRNPKLGALDPIAVVNTRLLGRTTAIARRAGLLHSTFPTTSVSSRRRAASA